MLHEGAKRDETSLVHATLHADAAFYSAHPHLAVAADGTWLVVFTQAPREPIVLHPPLEPRFRNMLMRSMDEGQTWTEPEPVPDKEMAGVECAGLTTLPDGRILLNQWQFDWIPPEEIREGGSADVASPEALAQAWARSEEFAGLHKETDPVSVRRFFRFARKGGRCRIASAEDGQSAFRHAAIVETQPFSGGYGIRGGVVLRDGEVVLPLCDVPHYRQVFVVRSSDGGRSWSAPTLAASRPDAEFEEPAPILLVLRDNSSRQLHIVASTDGGRTWCEPQETDISDYPADLLQRPDGLLVLVAGRRREPFGITLYLSRDRGRSWSPPHIVQEGFADPDLGYPTLASRSDGSLAVIYYARDQDGVTGIRLTSIDVELINAWSRDEWHR